MAVFQFDELTWPEVAALPRHTALVLPFGSLPALDVLSAHLSASSPIGLLPAIPFGWSGSGLDLPVEVFEALVRNLVAGLLEDGFNNIYLLVPPGLPVGLDIPLIPSVVAGCKPALLLGQPPFSGADLEKVLILPIGHTEQHGYHAPLCTDTRIIEAIGRGTARAVPQQCVCLPVFPYGVSTHRRSFPGTFNAGGRAFEDFWLAVVDALVERGFSRFYLMSGHGGNCSFLVNVVKYAGERYPQIFCATSFLYLSGPQGVAALEAKRESRLGGMGHACELETSLMLHLCPELVHLERAVDETDFITTPSYYMDWIDGGALVANPPWQDDTRTGAYGAGSLGTAEKGKYWLEAAIAEKAGHIGEIQAQYRRRRERRERL
ncbi:MAG TPA: creatininase family protein [Anaerolineales bacterium]|nr:creatininase family protein [Anaerolineales bacterium]